MATDSKRKLQPCPFCGAKVEIASTGMRIPNYFIRCSQCGMVTAWFSAQEELAKYWNTRVWVVNGKPQKLR